MLDDLRHWLDKVAHRKELKVIDGADSNLEIGAVTRLNWGNRQNPALLFDKIKGYPPGYRILTSSTSAPSRIALTFGLEYSDERHLFELFCRKLPEWLANREIFIPLVVNAGPVLQNVHSGNDVDLSLYPAPVWHEDDGGRYIGTGCAVITRSPDSGEINLGTYRIMLHDRNTLGLFMEPGRHGRIHCENYHLRGKSCPVAISFGHHPLYFRTSAAALPLGAEYSFIGSVMGHPMEVIIEEITGLPVPAHSELVVAGWCPPGEYLPEGPFGEYTGYYGRRAPAPIIKVERVYHRHNPTILGSPPGRAPSDSSYFMALMGSAVIHNFLTASGIPDIKGVWLCEVGGPQIIIVSLKQRYAGHAKQAALMASQSHAGTNMGRYVIVVDDDINPMDIQAVLWAMAYRSDPSKDIDILRRTKSGPLDPMIARPAMAFFTSVGVIDACKPFERLDTFPKEIYLNPDLANKVKHYLE